EKELTTTVAIIAKRLRTKKPTTTHTAVAHSFAPTGVSRITRSSFPARGRTAIEEPAHAEYCHDDGKFYEAHDHRDRGGHGIVVLLESRLVGGDRYDARRARRRAKEDGGGEDGKRLHERQAERDRQAGCQKRQEDVPKTARRAGAEGRRRPLERRINARHIRKRKQEGERETGDD